ncbi:MAG: tRNA (adenosine(37)-N6)-threonylcarbamoyltransferase complex dimerization subunit type 1 TsaB [Pseudomonadota bacterium]
MTHLPPLILAIENSGMCGSVALVSGSNCLAEQSLFSRLTHSKRLLSSIERVMEECRVGWDEIDAIAVSLGPGSFTGLRIGLSTVKGLAMATSIPLIGISSLDGLASQFSFASVPVFPVFDARKKEVYTACYRPDGNGSMVRQGNYLVISPEKLCAKINEPAIFTGDGAAIYGELFKNELGDNAILAPEQIYFARASNIGFLALESRRNKDFLDPAGCTPLYVRASDAEINFPRQAMSAASAT